ncbi:hypothetical protein DID76_01660 [Candidatus Marinamargulisbacteria bacterium SCGC AG-414-C22]|nr:hypothetical protein DID76_01660 [Candidatus Marinamargulisbacteria bacterium SCGC AG-414-C22]
MSNDKKFTFNKSTDSYIEEYHENLRQNRYLEPFSHDSDESSETDLDAPSSDNFFAISKSHFGRSIQQLEHAFATKNRELADLKLEVQEAQKKIQVSYQIESTVSNLNQIVRFSKEKNDELEQKYKDKETRLENDFLHKKRFYENDAKQKEKELTEKLAELKDKELAEYDLLKANLMQKKDEKSAEFDSQLEALKHNFDNDVKELESNLDIIKRKTQEDTDCLEQVLIKKRSDIDDDFKAYEESLSEKRKDLELEHNTFVDSLTQINADLVKDKESLLIEIEEGKKLIDYEHQELQKIRTDEHNQLLAELSQKKESYDVEISGLTTLHNQLTEQVSGLQIQYEEYEMASYELNTVYAFNKDQFDVELKQYEHDAKNKLDRYLNQLSEDHKKMLSSEKETFKKSILDQQLELSNEIKDKRMAFDNEISILKDSIEQDLRLKTQQEFKQLIEFEREKYERDIGKLTKQLADFEDAKSLVVAEGNQKNEHLESVISQLKVELSQAKIELDNVSDSMRKAHLAHSEQRYKDLLDTQQKKFDKESFVLKKNTVSLERDLDVKKQELRKAELEIKKYQTLLTKYVNSGPAQKDAIKNDDFIYSDKVIRANSFADFD